METQPRKDKAGRQSWNERDRSHFEQRLLDERKRAVAQMDQFHQDLRASQGDADGEIATWRFHMADEGTDTYEREQSFLLASREGRLLLLIDQALRTLYRSPDGYGRCEECHALIAYERLDAIPYAKTCVACKHDWEDGRAD